MKKRILHVVGARPNLMKAASVIREMSNFPDWFDQQLVHTGQHYDRAMSKVFFDELDLPEPDVYLEVGSGTHAIQTTRIMTAFEPVIDEQSPDWIVVAGDVNSTLACALVASKRGVKIAHVESGLRSFDRNMPEEINRLLTDQVSDLLFVSEPSGMENLRNEGIARDKIHFVGNTMIDTLLHFKKKSYESTILNALGLRPKEFAVMALHRPSNVDNPETLQGILRAVNRIARQLPVVFPVHPRTRQRIEEPFTGSEGGEDRGTDTGDLRPIAPLGYLDFTRLMAESRMILTDSGGIQEESTILGVPCLTLRENTERPVTVSAGTNQIIGTDPVKIIASSQKILEEGPSAKPAPQLWDGHAARRIVDIFKQH